MRGSDNMLIDYEVMGQRLRNARKEKGFSQTIASEKLDISIAYLSRIERGKAQVNLKRLVEMCSLYETSISEILTGVEKQKKEYLNQELYNIIMQCTPEKQRLIYKIAKVVAISNFV